MIILQPMVDYVDQKELEWKDLQLSDAVIRELIERSFGLIVVFLNPLLPFSQANEISAV